MTKETCPACGQPKKLGIGPVFPPTTSTLWTGEVTLRDGWDGEKPIPHPDRLVKPEGHDRQ